MMMCRRIGDKSLVKIYKDLMVTKRELTDLRESIAFTLSSLKQPMPKNPSAIHTKKKICFSCGVSHEPAAPHQCRAAPRKLGNQKQSLKIAQPINQNRRPK
jgi:ribosomal protein L37E